MSLFIDQELISLLKAKEKRGFDLLYDTYGNCLYFFILRIVTDKQLAEQALEDTFIIIWQQSPKYDSSKGSFLSWMLTIAYNTAHKSMPSLTK